MKQSLSICPLFFVFAFLIGCGPTRKEYAINEALLIDQTRMLEDQLYRAHFEIQALQDENCILREQLCKSPKKSEQAMSAVPIDGSLNVPRPETQEGYADPGQNAFPADELTFGANAPAQAPNGMYRQAPARYAQSPPNPQAPSRYRVAQQPAPQRALRKQNYRAQGSGGQLK